MHKLLDLGLPPDCIVKSLRTMTVRRQFVHISKSFHIETEFTIRHDICKVLNLLSDCGALTRHAMILWLK